MSQEFSNTVDFFGIDGIIWNLRFLEIHLNSEIIDQYAFKIDMNKQNRLILIYWSAYIFRAYYGLPAMNRADGTPINAVFGFTNMLVKLIEDYRDDKMIVIFDAARENFRNKIFSLGYIFCIIFWLLSSGDL